MAMTPEEKEARKLERQRLKKEKLEEAEKSKQEFLDKKNKEVSLFRECDYVNQLENDLLFDFIQVCNREYPELETEEIIKMIFQKFVNGEFKFQKKTIYV